MLWVMLVELLFMNAQRPPFSMFGTILIESYTLKHAQTLMRLLVILLLIIVVIIIAISSSSGSLLRRLLLLLLALALGTGIAGNRALKEFQNLLICDLLVGGELA